MFLLMHRMVKTPILSTPRVVQGVKIVSMEPEVQRQWAERVVRAVNVMFPSNPTEIATWPQCLRYLDQTQACTMLIRHYMLSFIEAADLLNRTGLYLWQHALYTVAEPLYQQALLIREQQLGATHLDTAGTLNNLALLYRAQGKNAEA